MTVPGPSAVLRTQLDSRQPRHVGILLAGVAGELQEHVADPLTILSGDFAGWLRFSDDLGEGIEDDAVGHQCL